MKRIRKLLAVLLAVAMVMSMGTSVLAELGQADSGTLGSSSVEITGVASTNHTFTAYEIFKGTVSGIVGSYVLSDIEWGDCVNSTALLNYLKNTETDAYSDGSTWKELFGLCETAEDVVKVLTNTNNDSLTKAFADLLAVQVSGEYTYLSKYSAIANSGEDDDSGSTYKYTFLNLEAGYYLITDSYTSAEKSDDSLSDYFLQVAGATTIANKTVVPTVSKTVTDMEGNKSDATSASANETVSFTLVGTVPSDVAKYYTSYTYKFVDTLSQNLSYVSDSIAVKVYSDEDLSSLYLTLGTASGSDAYYSLNTDGGLTVEILNAITLAGKYIVVTYDATVSSGISSDNAETNSVYVEYSNNPNTSATGKTTEDTVKVYTFDLELTKTYSGDAPESGDEAKFKLFKKVTTTLLDADFGGDTKYYTINRNTATEATSYSDGDVYYTYVSEQAVSSASPYTATFSDLGEGNYILIESHTPTGYNTADAVEFAITATYEDGSVTSLEESTNVTPKSTAASTTLTKTIANNAGTVIPTTGGIGTTIFYVVGAVLVLGAAVILVTRRRMASR